MNQNKTNYNLEINETIKLFGKDVSSPKSDHFRWRETTVTKVENGWIYCFERFYNTHKVGDYTAALSCVFVPFNKKSK